MNVRHSRLARLVTLTVVASMPLLGMAGIASAKTHHHHHGGSGGSTGGGTGGPPPFITVTVDPNPLVETGQSEVHAVVQVETSPSFAGDMVNIDSSQLEASCRGVSYFSLRHETWPVILEPEPDQRRPRQRRQRHRVRRRHWTVRPEPAWSRPTSRSLRSTRL